ncbi:MAG: hypothetical protein KJS97_08775 [Alphaproteobacteria bacterium]|nr:hypothetical protein [Alphaproteobacteria bacterium]
MARAAFEKGQRVFVRAVGMWATVERVIPQWVKGVDEPFRIFYDVGLGREFSAHELAAPAGRSQRELHQEAWTVRRIHAPGLRVDRPRPNDATMPVVVTETDDWGGWRVEPIEYDRDPARIEHHAKLIANAPRLLAAAKALAAYAEAPEDAEAPARLKDAIALAQTALRGVYTAEPELEDAVAPGAARA